MSRGTGSKFGQELTLNEVVVEIWSISISKCEEGRCGASLNPCDRGIECFFVAAHQVASQAAEDPEPNQSVARAGRFIEI